LDVPPASLPLPLLPSGQGLTAGAQPGAAAMGSSLPDPVFPPPPFPPHPSSCDRRSGQQHPAGWTSGRDCSHVYNRDQPEGRRGGGSHRWGVGADQDERASSSSEQLSDVHPNLGLPITSCLLGGTKGQESKRAAPAALQMATSHPHDTVSEQRRLGEGQKGVQSCTQQARNQEGQQGLTDCASSSVHNSSMSNRSSGYVSPTLNSPHLTLLNLKLNSLSGIAGAVGDNQPPPYSTCGLIFLALMCC